MTITVDPTKPTRPELRRPLRTSAGLIGVGLLVQLGSFAWNHPLAFILFGVGGGGLLAAGIGVFLVAAIRGRMWADPVGPPSSKA